MGILSLEMSLTAEECQDIIESWDSEAREDARRHLCWDYFLIPFYTTALAILGIMAATWFEDKGLPSMASIAIALAWGQWIAGLFDFTENSTLLRILSMHPTIPRRLPPLAGWCARIKFLFVLLGILSALVGMLVSLA